ncbi:hypothetical protein BH11ACT7_BH11ACT7_26960 [soil metagenome]
MAAATKTAVKVSLLSGWTGAMVTGVDLSPLSEDQKSSASQFAGDTPLDLRPCPVG